MRNFHTVPYRFTENNRRCRYAKFVRIGKSVRYPNGTLHIPALYTTLNNCTVDMFFEIDSGKVKAYAEKYFAAGSEFSQTAVQNDLIAVENPLDIPYTAIVTVNNKPVEEVTMSFEPLIPAGILPDTPESNISAICTAVHYGLNLSKILMFCRVSFPKSVVRKSKIKNVTLELRQIPYQVSGTRFKNPQSDDIIPIKNPVTGEEFSLNIISCEKTELDLEINTDICDKIPRFYTALKYTVTPDTGNFEFDIQDCTPCDKSLDANIFTDGNNIPHNPNDVSAVAVIGGADGPTAVFCTASDSKSRTATSSLKFEPPENIEWKAVFDIYTSEDITIDLI